MLRIIFSVIIFFHGFIHLMGFFKAFGIAEIEQLTQTISEPLGLLWLVAALLFIVLSVLILLKQPWAWLPALLGIIISQSLIILSWQDAKFGTIPNVIILVLILFSIGAWKFNRMTHKEVSALLSKVNGNDVKIINEQMLHSLPGPVKKWLKNVGIVGKQEIQSAYFQQRGKMKLQPHQKEWAHAKVEQYVTTNSPGFLWKVNMKMFSFLNVAGRDKFTQGNAEMTIKIGSLFPVVNVKNNKKTNQSTMQRFLMELPWYPSAALSPYITWEEIDQNTAKATMNYQGTTGSATFTFDELGNFLSVSAMRYKDADEHAELVECIGEAKAFRVEGGMKIPTEMSVTWILDDGPFTWYSLQILRTNYK